MSEPKVRRNHVVAVFDGDYRDIADQNGWNSFYYRFANSTFITVSAIDYDMAYRMVSDTGMKVNHIISPK